MANLKKLQYDINIESLNSLLHKEQRRRPSSIGEEIATIKKYDKGADDEEISQIFVDDANVSSNNSSVSSINETNANYNSNKKKILPDCPLVPEGLSK